MVVYMKKIGDINPCLKGLSIMQAGVEIDGIQIDPTTGNNYTVGDNMLSKLGDKYNRIYVPVSYTHLDVYKRQQIHK